MLCTLCQTLVYHAEITYGPGRKPYHKPCLKCGGCGKRLEAGSLVEHDLEPYCKNCHLKTFGTRDLRHNNIPHAPAAAISPSSSSSFAQPPSSPRYESPRYQARSQTITQSPAAPPPPPISYLPSPKPRPPPPSPSSKPTTSYLPSSSAAASSNLQRSISSPSNQYSPNPPERSAASLAISSRSASSYSPSNKKPLFNTAPTPRCPACNNPVYFAEQAIALDKKWHKACLRCSVCKKGLSQGGVQEHDGDVVCPPCYKKNFGPQGGGYALS